MENETVIKQYTQAEVDSINAAHEASKAAAVEEIRSTAAAAIKANLGVTDANSYLDQRMQADNKNALRLAALDRIFQSSVESQKLAKSDMAVYRTLRAEWLALSGHAAPKAVSTPGSHAFRKNGE